MTISLVCFLNRAQHRPPLFMNMRFRQNICAQTLAYWYNNTNYHLKTTNYILDEIVICLLCMTGGKVITSNSVAGVEYSKIIASDSKSKEVNMIQVIKRNTWWRHQMETFSELLALCAGNSPVPRWSQFPSPRPVTWSFDVFFDLPLNKRLSKHSRRRWFETPSRSLLRHSLEWFHE